MTTKDIKQCQITLISKTGKVFVGKTDNDVLLNFMATIVKFIEIDKEKTDTIKLKDLL